MDTLSRRERSQRMSLVRGVDTKPEMIVRSAVHRLGYRYRLHVSTMPGKPDLVFPKLHTVLFVHGCYWHRHPTGRRGVKSEEHTSELQSLRHLVCRLLLET